MRETRQATGFLERAIVAFENATGLHAEARIERRDPDRPDTLLDVFVDERTFRFAAEIKAIDRFQTLGTIKANEHLAQDPPLLVAPYVTEAIAERCRELHLPFIDAAGNAFISEDYSGEIYRYAAGGGSKRNRSPNCSRRFSR